MSSDATQDFLNSLPEIRTGETFAFACHPRVKCFNACCGDLNLVLTPYDALRLRRSLGEPSRIFMTERCSLVTAPDTGFPLLTLNMAPGPQKPCPFVRAEGCSVYPDRPAACRTYPLGRATRLTADGDIEQQFFVVREAHCKGFAEQKEWSPETWLCDQGLEPYNEASDRLTALMGRMKESGQRMSSKQANMALLALYQPDDFRSFITNMRLFERVEVDEARQAEIMADDEATLEFALDWLELALFGDSPRLTKRTPPSSMPNPTDAS